MHASSALRLGTVALLVVAAGFEAASAAPPADLGDKEAVGHADPKRAITPVNQVLTPAGRQVDLPGMRPQALALSPNGSLLVLSGKTREIVVVDPHGGTIRQRVEFPVDEQPITSPEASPQILHPEDEQVSFTGLLFSPRGDQVYLSNVEGSIKVFSVAADGQVAASHSLPLPPADAPRRKPEIPSGLAISADGKLLYVCGNLSNRLIEIDVATRRTLRTFDVGVAPYDVVLVGRKAYVSNWGGRRPDQGDLTGPAGRGTVVRVDPVRHIASEGSVSVLDLDSGKTVREVICGLHASGLAVSPDGRYVVCANAGSDHLSVIAVETDAVVDTMWAKAKPSDLLGASPNAVAFDKSGQRLYAANGAQNAVAVFDFDPEDRGESKLRGLIPVGWYPGALVVDQARRSLCVANIKGLAKEPEPAGRRGAKGFNSHQYFGSLSLVPIPLDDDLPHLSEIAARNLRQPRIAAALLPPRKGQPPRPVPERIGEPSLIRHVVYIIKENRTYDQVLGDVPRGNGDPSLCIFGAEATPNEHKLVDEFVLLDNAYCSGILSADGHQWSTTAFSTDYMEKSFAGFPRSYPDGMGEDENDALAYSPGGFIWDRALEHHKSFRDYGEFMMPAVRWRDPARGGDTPPFAACYHAWKSGGDDVIFRSEPSVETLRPHAPEKYVGWEMAVPDQYRADFILNELAQFEAKGEFPQLVIVCLPNDHTSGTKAGWPTPRAFIADNDLAFGRIVEGLSRSKFWKDMAIFAIEDDPQAGWDHVSGYRTTMFCISPYAKRGGVVSTQYNTTSILRTIGQILGMPPMNQFDASATPMWDCFIDAPDFKPYVAVPATIPLDEMNPEVEAINDPALREDAIRSASINFREIDRAPEDVLNRILWRSMRGSQAPYPEWAVSAPGVDDEDEEEEEELEERGEQASPESVE